MNFYAARELHDADGKGLGKWNYTNYNDNQKATWAVGYCAGWPEYLDKPWDPVKLPWFHSAENFREHVEKISKFKEKYHSQLGTPHCSAEEACECYRQYQLDNNLVFTLVPKEDPRVSSLQRCKVCNEFTANQAMVNHQVWHLCDVHLNRETVEKFYSVGESYGSY